LSKNKIPKISSKISELFSQRKDLEIEHELVAQEAIKLHVLHHANEEFGIPEVRGNLVVLNIGPINVELGCGQVCETETLGANQVLGGAVGITH
jgi:hypothetical protein